MCCRLYRQADRQLDQRKTADATNLTIELDGSLNPANVRRDFRKVVDAAGLNGNDWTPREMRHSFVSVLSANDVELKEISLLVGHSATGVTKKVYRQEIRPVLLKGAEAMDRIFPADDGQPGETGGPAGGIRRSD